MWLYTLVKNASRLGSKPGQIITVSVKKNIFKKHVVKKSRIIHKGQICKALIIGSAKGVKRWGNFFLRTRRNRIILLNQYGMPYATRLFGPVFRDVRLNAKYIKIISLFQASF